MSLLGWVRKRCLHEAIHLPGPGLRSGFEVFHLGCIELFGSLVCLPSPQINAPLAAPEAGR